MKAVIFSADWDPRPDYPLSEKERITGKATLSSKVWRHPTFTMKEAPLPSIAPDEVLLKTRACGVCGSDTHCYEQDKDGYILFSGPVKTPVICGHEYTAEVVEVGASVRNLRVGELVAGEGMLSCGVCEACRIGNPNQCPHLEMLGFSAPGAFAEFLISKERFLWSLDSVAHKIGSAELACELGALIEPVACSYNGMFVAAGGFKPGGHIVVFGCGPIGLGAIALARAAGAGSILAFDISPERNKVAMELGADAAYDPRATPAVDAVLTLTRGWGADMVVEAAGAAIQTMPAIEKIFAPGGKMVYLGRTGLKAPVLLDVLVTQAAMIVGARGHSGGGCFPRILRLIEQNRLQLSPMITRRFPFHQTIDALAASCDRSDAKIMVKF